MFQIHDPRRNACMLTGSFARRGYDWWWHSFTAVSRETGEEQPCFIEFFLCNPALGGAQPVLGQKPENRAAGRRPSYLMVKAGCWGGHKKQLHRFFGWDEVTVAKGAPYRVAAADCLADDTTLRGSVSVLAEEVRDHPEVMCDAGTMEWDLKIDKQIAFHVGYGAGALFRALKAFEMYWHAEGMKSVYSGTVTIDGEVFDVLPERSYGYADKNWGRGFTSPWVWLSSNSLVSNLTGKRLENSVFDIGGGRPKVFFAALERKLLGAFYYEGQQFEYNFSKFWQAPSTEFESREDDGFVYWHVRQANRRSVMDTTVRCRKADMLLVNYESPDGEKRHNRLWNGGSGEGRILLYRKKGGTLELIDDIRADRIGCEYGEYTK